MEEPDISKQRHRETHTTHGHTCTDTTEHTTDIHTHTAHTRQTYPGRSGLTQTYASNIQRHSESNTGSRGTDALDRHGPGVHSQMCTHRVLHTIMGRLTAHRPFMASSASQAYCLVTECWLPTGTLRQQWPHWDHKGGLPSGPGRCSSGA